MRGYIILAVLALATMYAYGKMQHQAGKRDLVAAIEKARVASVEQKQRIDDEISQLSDDDLLKRALGYVSRGGR